MRPKGSVDLRFTLSFRRISNPRKLVLPFSYQLLLELNALLRPKLKEEAMAQGSSSTRVKAFSPFLRLVTTLMAQDKLAALLA